MRVMAWGLLLVLGGCGTSSGPEPSPEPTFPEPTATPAVAPRVLTANPVPPPGHGPWVVVVAATVEADFSGDWRVSGRLRNQGDRPARDVGVALRWARVEGWQEGEAIVDRTYLEPGQESAFGQRLAGTTVLDWLELRPYWP